MQAIGDFPLRVIQWCGGQAGDSGVQDAIQNIQGMTSKMQDFVNRMGAGRYEVNK